MISVVFDTLGGTKLRQMVTQSFSSNESLSENKVTLTQLTPNTKYNISVSACTSKGCGKAAISSCNTTVADNRKLLFRDTSMYCMLN